MHQKTIRVYAYLQAYRMAKKVGHYQIIGKSYLISLKPANEIRFIRQIEVSVMHCNIHLY